MTIHGHPNKGLTLVHELSAAMEGCGQKPSGNCMVSMRSWLLLRMTYIAIHCLASATDDSVSDRCHDGVRLQPYDHAAHTASSSLLLNESLLSFSIYMH